MNNCLKSIGTWKADSNTIYIRYPKNKYHKQFGTINYFLNKEKDSLFINYKNKNEYDYVYRKVKNNWKHYLSDFDLKIDLPQANFPLIEKKRDFGIDIYAGYKDGGLIMRDNWRKDLKNLRNTFYTKLESTTYNDHKLVHFNLIADEHIPEKQIDSINKILKSVHNLKRLPKIKIFRVYRKENSDYGIYDLYCEGKSWNWFGRYE